MSSLAGLYAVTGSCAVQGTPSYIIFFPHIVSHSFTSGKGCHFQCIFLSHLKGSCVGEGNGNPLQCSCLENPRDGGAWWAAVYGVAQSQTQLK